MYTDIDKKLVEKFLEKNYPVSRIKHNLRFRRCIVLDDGSFFVLGDNQNNQKLKYTLLESLKVVFNYDNSTLITLLDNFLQRY